MKARVALLGCWIGLALTGRTGAQGPSEPLPPASAPALASSAPAPTPITLPQLMPVPAAASVARFSAVEPIDAGARRQVHAPWFDQQLGAEPAAWRFSAALDAAGAAGQAEALRRQLLHRHLGLLLGEPADPNQTVRQALADGLTLGAPEADPELRRRWAEVMNRQLRVTLPAAPVPVPAELEADAARLRELAPGLWSLHAADGVLRARLWWLLLRNQSALPLALADFRLRAPAGPGSIGFDCSLPRYAEAMLAAPGVDTAYLCRTGAGVGSATAWADLTALLRSKTPLPVQIEPHDLAAPLPVARVFARLEAPHKAAAEPLVAQVQEPQVGGRPGAPAVQPLPALAPAAVRSGAAPWAAGLAAVAALGFYALLTRAASRRTALVTTWMLLFALALAAAFKGLPGGWSPLPQVDLRRAGGSALPLLTAVLAPALATLMLALCHELLLGERLGILRAAGRWLLEGPLDDWAERLFSRPRR